MTATAEIGPGDDLKQRAEALFARKRLMAFSAPVVILAYFIYLFFAFDISGLVDRARMDNAAILVADSYSYKTHVTHDNRNGGLGFAIEGENKGTYPDGMMPGFVTSTGEDAVKITLDAGEVAEIEGSTLRYSLPDYGTVIVTVEGRDISVETPDGTIPDWISASNARVNITGEGG